MCTARVDNEREAQRRRTDKRIYMNTLLHYTRQFKNEDGCGYVKIRILLV
jgi:hypothetical protein